MRVDRDVKGRTRGYAHSLAWADWKWDCDQVWFSCTKWMSIGWLNQVAFLEDFRKVSLRIHVTNGLSSLISAISVSRTRMQRPTTPEMVVVLRTIPEKEKHLRRRAASKADRAAAPSAGLALRPAPFPGHSIGVLFGNLR